MTKKYPKRWRTGGLPAKKEIEKLCQGLDVSTRDVFICIVRSFFKDTKREYTWRNKSRRAKIHRLTR
jgi:hypothetical protein